MQEYDILKKLQKDEGIIKAEVMPEEVKKEVLRLEMDRLNELIPLINKGIEEVFKEEEQAIVIRDYKIPHNIIITEEEETPVLTLVNESGTIIGEEITDEEELEELHQRKDVIFISDNFIIDTNLSAPGEKQFFVIRSINSAVLSNQELESTVKNLVVAIPSTNTDNYLKDVYGYDFNSSVGILVIGFSE